MRSGDTCHSRRLSALVQKAAASRRISAPHLTSAGATDHGPGRWGLPCTRITAIQHLRLCLGRQLPLRQLLRLLRRGAQHHRLQETHWKPSVSLVFCSAHVNDWRNGDCSQGPTLHGAAARPTMRSGDTCHSRRLSALVQKAAASRRISAPHLTSAGATDHGPGRWGLPCTRITAIQHLRLCLGRQLPLRQLLRLLRRGAQHHRLRIARCRRLQRLLCRRTASHVPCLTWRPAARHHCLRLMRRPPLQRLRQLSRRRAAPRPPRLAWRRTAQLASLDATLLGAALLSTTAFAPRRLPR